MNFLQKLRKTSHKSDKEIQTKELDAQAEIAQLQSMLVAKNSTITHLESQLDHLNEYYVNEYSSLWTETNRELEIKIDELTEDLNQREKELNRCKLQMKVLDKRLAQTNKLSDKLSDDLNKSMNQVNSQNITIKLLQQKNISYIKQNEQLKTTASTQIDQIKFVANQEILKAKSQIDGQSREISQLINESSYKTSQILTYVRQVNQLQQQLNHSNSVESLALSKVKTQISGQNRKINQLTNENTSYADEIKNLKSQLVAKIIDEDTTAISQKTSTKKRVRQSRRSFFEEIKAAEPEPADLSSSIHDERNDEDSFDCTICGSNQSILNRVLFTPCGHGSCYKCGNQITNCHVCESSIIEKLKQFE